MTQTAPSSFFSKRRFLSALFGKAAGTISDIGALFEHYGRNLNELVSRYFEGRFHLSVLGQFKRGKSTLLNALTGEPILPVGVTPLTSAPTFLQYGEAPKISVQFKGGRPADEFTGVSTAERSVWLAGFDTEKGNPQNKLGVVEVQVVLLALYLLLIPMWIKATLRV